MDKTKVFVFLDALRASGATNMFGAVPYIVEAFPEMTQKEARGLLVEWMHTFNERHPL